MRHEYSPLRPGSKSRPHAYVNSPHWVGNTKRLREATLWNRGWQTNWHQFYHYLTCQYVLKLRENIQTRWHNLGAHCLWDFSLSEDSTISFSGVSAKNRASSERSAKKTSEGTINKSVCPPQMHINLEGSWETEIGVGKKQKKHPKLSCAHKLSHYKKIPLIMSVAISLDHLFA